MEESKKETQHSPEALSQKGKKERHEVFTVRDWKEYLGESLLIIFSVVLALFLSEKINKIHEEQETRQVLRQLRDELINNKKQEEEQYSYHLSVLKNIDSALNNPSFAQQFIHNGEIKLSILAPFGVLLHDMNDVAWQIAKQNNVFAKIDLDTYSLLTDIYDNQQRITKTEDQVGNVLLSWESRKPENLRTALILVRDNYHAWAVDRAPLLLKKYADAIDRLSKYK